MEQKILQGLTEKFPDVDPKILQRIAANKSASVTEESQIPSLLDGIGINDVIQSHGDYRAGDAVFSYKKKHEGTENRPKNNPPEKEDGKERTKTEDEDRFAQLERKIEALEKEKAQNEREVTASRAADKVPGFPKRLLSDINFPEGATEDEMVAKLTKIQQSLIDSGLSGIEPEVKATNDEAIAKECESLVEKYSTK